MVFVKVFIIFLTILIETLHLKSRRERRTISPISPQDVKRGTDVATPEGIIVVFIVI
jgi:hypothetical protein